MRDFVARRPVLFAIGVTLFDTAMGVLAFLIGRAIGLPETALIFLALAVSTAVPLGFIWRLGWWRDAGFVTTTQNASALAVPIIIMPIAVIFFGTIEIEPPVVLFLLAAFFLTGVSEEALSRGLLLRALLPWGRWPAVLIPSALFGLGHITNLLAQEMPLQDNLLQIANAAIFGLLYGAVRLRINNIWPLIVTHAFFDVFAALAGLVGPGAVRGLSDIPATMWIVLWSLSLAGAFYCMTRKTITATIDGRVAR